MVAPTWSMSAERLDQEKVGICDRIYEAFLESTQIMTPEKVQDPEFRAIKLGYLDSNQEQKNQNLPCCQLHHTPPHPGRTQAD